MENILTGSISSEEIKKFEEVYRSELRTNNSVSDKTKFEYAWCLVQSDNSSDIRRGIILLNELCRDENAESVRDYMYYLAIGNARIKNYNKALDILNHILRTEPTNNQVLELQKLLKKKLNSDALAGAVAVGGGLVGVGALIAIGATIIRAVTKN